MRLLLTAFEPFGGRSTNASATLLGRIVAHAPTPESPLDRLGVELIEALLPVHWTDGPACLLELADRHTPGAIVCLGESARADRLLVERVAVNLAGIELLDNAGEPPASTTLIEGAPDRYLSTLPHEALVSAITRAGAHASTSDDMGTYLCNAVTFSLLHHQAKHGVKRPAGFIHVPTFDESRVCSDSVEVIASGLVAAIVELAMSFEEATPPHNT